MRMHDVITDEHEMGKCDGPGKCCLCEKCELEVAEDMDEIEDFVDQEIEAMRKRV